jgi:quercetin dioxygenase-like cupin family protein
MGMTDSNCGVLARFARSLEHFEKGRTVRIRYVLSLTGAFILLSGYCIARIGGVAQSGTSVGPTPLILEKEEGEQRVRRPREIPVPTGAFNIKVDRFNGGSNNLVLGTEIIAPGGAIPRHKHLGQDEILLIQTGTAYVWLGEKQREVHRGAVVFIPAETWISVKNSGNEDVSLTFIFSAPGFETYLRCTSVPEGEKANPMTSEEWRECQHGGHISFEAAPRPTAFSQDARSSLARR